MKKKQQQSNWWAFWDNVNLPLLKRIKNAKRRKTVWRLDNE